MYRLIGMWALRRGYRVLTADDPRPLNQRLRGEARRIVIGAAITLVLLIVGVILLVALLISLAT